MMRIVLWLALGVVSGAAPARKVPDRDRSAEVRERAIQECMDDRDGDPDEDRELCEDEFDDG